MSRIGIFSGSFDPVHEGHVRFALQAQKQAKLDEVYFLPEVKPRRKTGITHIAHRVAMLRLATSSHPGLHILELPDRQYSVARSLPKLRQLFQDNELFLLVGSDVLGHMSRWPLAGRMLEQLGLVIAARGDTNTKVITTLVHALPHHPKELHVIKSPLPVISSRLIRETIAQGKSSTGLSPAIQKYITKNWLYSTYVSSSSSGSRS